MEIIRVNSREELDYLYNYAALTVVGISEKSFNDFMNILKENTIVYRQRMFIISGKLMNEEYGLKGRNAYKDNLNIASVSLEDFDEGPMILKRFEYGWKWFNDIVDNNRRIERFQRKKKTA